jgi:dephospho-CoA kinase
MNAAGSTPADVSDKGGRPVVVAGLTGGIASGKSTVAEMMAGAGAHRIDADRIAHALIRRGTPAYTRILSRFGSGLLGPDGEIDRRRLGEQVFADPDARRELETIVHPGVREEIARRLESLRRAARAALVLLEVPLLFEAGMDRGLDEVIVVYVPEEVQLERLLRRDRLTAAEAVARIRAQMPLAQKRALATRVIDNSGSLEETRVQALALYRQLAPKNTEGGEQRS